MKKLLSLLFPLSSLLSPLSSLLFISCGIGDDDGSRLGEQIVGTWYRDSLVLEGDTGLEPEDLTYHRFDFLGDGTYNGMIRQGSFSAISRFGNLIYEGTYKCDNSNLRLEFVNDDGKKQSIHAQVVSFTADQMLVRYESDEYNIGVKLWLKKGEAATNEKGE